MCYRRKKILMPLNVPTIVIDDKDEDDVFYDALSELEDMKEYTPKIELPNKPLSIPPKQASKRKIVDFKDDIFYAPPAKKYKSESIIKRKKSKLSKTSKKASKKISKKYKSLRAQQRAVQKMAKAKTTRRKAMFQQARKIVKKYLKPKKKK